MVGVQDVLAQPALALRGVFVPRPAEPVRWVATSELADPSPFLEGGEVLLTTGLDTSGWRDEWEGYVARLRAAGVAAIGFATGLTHDRVPDRLERACRAREVNLFEVPRHTPFVAISRLTARLLEERDRADSRRAVVMQRELTEAAARRDDPGALLRTLSGQVDGGTALLTSTGTPDGGPVGTPPPPSLDMAAEVARIRPQGLRTSASVTVGGHTVVIQPVGVGTRPEGYLAVWSPQPLTDGQRGAVTTAVALLGLAAERRHDRRETDRRLRARALELLLGGDARTTAVLLAAADDRPGEAELPERIRVAWATGDPDAVAEAVGVLESAPAARGTPVLLAGPAGDVLRLADAPERVELAAARLAELGLRVGVGAAVGLDDGERAATTARYALAQTTDVVPVVHWDELVDDGVLALVGDRAAAAFAASFLGPIAGRADLLLTLRAFLRHHGSRGKVAAELTVHRNTVRHRLEEIEVALGRSLDDPATRVSAWVALQADAARRLEG
ncbi:PucR family transcriptional regulator [Georgenia yuyongxinii]|uniref:PucR family transcriptional regulator n=1 Tax=Georgenia yuyongxinii TaxID=2589797 RepID=A0A5B8C6Q6_9MICO|nr:PucR family transcriptional regulator [Georgenia yuyongxinii]QDC25015.1 PucR family transcriptional regulator [Georgenia yuyongxinii]